MDKKIQGNIYMQKNNHCNAYYAYCIKPHHSGILLQLHKKILQRKGGDFSRQ